MLRLGWRAALAAVGMAGMAGEAAAVVDGREDPALGRQAVMVLNSHGGFCTASVLAPTVLLTAAHCVTGSTAYLVFFRDADGSPVQLQPKAVSMHPEFRRNAVAERRKSIDLALVRLGAPLPDRFAPVTLDARGTPAAGETLTVAGYGLGRDGQAATGGTFRRADLAVIQPYGPSKILVWLADPAAGKGGNGAGACGGDSGGPIFGPDGRLVAVTAFAEGAAGRQCGSLTQGVLVAPHRAWIDKVRAGWR
jgi:hypothetical protein